MYDKAKKIVYVILHFNAYDMTCKCIECILKICGDNSEIVIVDNCSPDGSGVLLQEKYKAYNKIHLLLSTQNLGFAKGNNIGYSFARLTLKADIIIDMNNDILIEQSDFEKNLLKLVNEKDDCAVIAPDIINRNGFHQNPFRLKRLSSIYFLKSLILHCIYMMFLMCGIGKLLYSFYHKNDAVSRAVTEFQDEVYDIIPHGSCIIFLPHFLAISEYAFNPNTFFYCEEDILYDYLRLHKMKTVYTNRLYVKHMEKVSTNSISDSVWEKEKFQIKNKIRSRIILLRYRMTHHM